MRRMVSGCDGLILEFNHDPALLRAGPYPPSVRQRVAGNLGHLANDQAAELLAGIGFHGIRHLVIGHMSATNNRRELVLESLSRVCRTLPGRAMLAEQDQPSDWLTLPPSTD
jgi:phosphoribosyl 1,2-cyclic phosphodiesterase